MANAEYGWLYGKNKSDSIFDSGPVHGAPARELDVVHEAVIDSNGQAVVIVPSYPSSIPRTSGRTELHYVEEGGRVQLAADGEKETIHGIMRGIAAANDNKTMPVASDHSSTGDKLHPRLQGKVNPNMKRYAGKVIFAGALLAWGQILYPIASFGQGQFMDFQHPAQLFADPVGVVKGVAGIVGIGK